jgi:hypothetical protein
MGVCVMEGYSMTSSMTGGGGFSFGGSFAGYSFFTWWTLKASSIFICLGSSYFITI